MTFWELNAVFLGLGLGVLLAAALVGRVRARHVGAILLTTAALWVLTAVFDNVMIASGLFDYGGHALAGVRVGLAPIEDFAYPLGSALLLPAVWLLLTGGRTGGPVTPAEAVRTLGPVICVLGLAAAGTALGVVWEVAEWWGHHEVTEEIGVGYDDTLGDLTADLVGAVTAAVVAVASARSVRRGAR